MLLVVKLLPHVSQGKFLVGLSVWEDSLESDMESGQAVDFFNLQN